VTVDTLEYMKRLEAAGVDRKQAEAHAEAVRDTLATQLATKADIDRLDSKIDTKIAELRATIYQAMFVQGLAIVGLTVSLVKLLP
jgi:hypothetical protein